MIISIISNQILKTKASYKVYKAMESRFFCSAADGDLASLKEMLLSKISIDSLDYSRQSALQLAALHGRIEVVRFLIHSGADINYTNIWGKTAMDYAEYNGHHSVKYLLESAGNLSVGGDRTFCKELKRLSRASMMASLSTGSLILESINEKAEPSPGETNISRRHSCGNGESMGCKPCDLASIAFTCRTVRYLTAKGASLDAGIRWGGESSQAAPTSQSHEGDEPKLESKRRVGMVEQTLCDGGPPKLRRARTCTFSQFNNSLQSGGNPVHRLCYGDPRNLGDDQTRSEGKSSRNLGHPVTPEGLDDLVELSHLLPAARPGSALDRHGSIADALQVERSLSCQKEEDSRIGCIESCFPSGVDLRARPSSSLVIPCRCLLERRAAATHYTVYKQRSFRSGQLLQARVFRESAVLFIDIKGFTAGCAEMTVAEVRRGRPRPHGVHARGRPGIPQDRARRSPEAPGSFRGGGDGMRADRGGEG